MVPLWNRLGFFCMVDLSCDVFLQLCSMLAHSLFFPDDPFLFHSPAIILPSIILFSFSQNSIIFFFSYLQKTFTYIHNFILFSFRFLLRTITSISVSTFVYTNVDIFLFTNKHVTMIFIHFSIIT